MNGRNSSEADSSGLSGSGRFASKSVSLKHTGKRRE
jgi:hypothetical protein